MCHLKVVLFANGAGLNAATYKPNRDESQWWNRRDALVRCVTAFLFGPATTFSRELIILYDEDWSRMHMTYTPGAGLVPTERAVISLWKRVASGKSGETVEMNGLTCRLEESGLGRENGVPSGLDSKRDVLEYLQKTCSMEFLRQEGLNSSTSVLLRKTNKKKLMESLGRWHHLLTSRQSIKKDSCTASSSLEPILSLLLKPDSEAIRTVIASTLHESSENELPCWDLDRHRMNDADDTQLCMFLGAVRDMSAAEHQCLKKVCEAISVPLVAVRLGPVPEFTSKILSIVAFHHSQQILGPAIHIAINGSRKRSQNDASLLGPFSGQCLHHICLAPIDSTALSLSLEERNRTMWCLVRCIVASLWRSRLVGQSSSGGRLDNRLTIVFTDGVHVTLLQDELVTSLAEQHQAAPSEFQIVKALCGKLPAAPQATTVEEVVVDWKEKCLEIVSAVVNSVDYKPLCLVPVDTSNEDTEDLAQLFYSSDRAAVLSNDGSAKTAIVLLAMHSNDHSLVRKQVKAFGRAAKKFHLPIHRCRVSSTETCQDREACTITFLQHSCYQNRLFPILLNRLPERVNKKQKKGKKVTST